MEISPLITALSLKDMTKRKPKGRMKKTRSQNVPGPARIQKTLLLSFQLSKTRLLSPAPAIDEC